MSQHHCIKEPALNTKHGFSLDDMPPSSTSQARHVHQSMQVFSVHAHVCSIISVSKPVGPQELQATKHVHGKSQSTWQRNSINPWHHANRLHASMQNEETTDMFHQASCMCTGMHPQTCTCMSNKHTTPCDNLQTSVSSSFIQSYQVSQAVNMPTHSNTYARIHANHAKDTIAVNIFCAWHLYLMKGAMFKQISETRFTAQAQVPKPSLLSANLPCAIFVCSASALCALSQCIFVHEWHRRDILATSPEQSKPTNITCILRDNWDCHACG